MANGKTEAEAPIRCARPRTNVINLCYSESGTQFQSMILTNVHSIMLYPASAAFGRNGSDARIADERCMSVKTHKFGKAEEAATWR